MPLTRSTRLRLGYLALAATDAWLAGSSRSTAHRARVLTKPLLMPALAGSLAAYPRSAASVLRTSTLVGQTFGWGGDLALMRHGTAAFAAGTGSFGVGHAAYIAGFTGNRDRGTRLRERSTTRFAAALALTAGPVLARGAMHQEAVLGPAVVGYSALISTMLATSAHLDRSIPVRARQFTLAGAALFVLSDTLLGMRKFVFTGASDRLETVVMATYAAGQLLISEGAARA